MNPAKLNDKFTNFADMVCVDLFVLADVEGKQQNFLNCVDKASGYQLVAPVMSKRPDEVFRIFNTTWLIPFGIPHNVLSDNGGEFDREFSDLVESLGATILRTASYAPTQNGTTERRGGAWKAHARAVMDEHSIKFTNTTAAEHLCAAVNYAVNQDIDESGYSPAQWVLGRGLRLPYGMLATHGQLAAQMRLGQDPDFTRRVGLLSPRRGQLRACATAADFPVPSRQETVQKPLCQQNGRTTLATRFSTGEDPPRRRLSGCTVGLDLA